MNDQDPRVILALRLRDLREHHWPRKVNQSQLAAALGGDGNRPVSVPLVSSWESRTNPAVPPVSRIEDIATFFASPRSFDGRTGRLLSPDEMTVQERTAREALVEELSRLRREALAAPGPPGLRATSPDEAREMTESLTASFYRFKVGQSVTIVCARLPQRMLERMPYTDPMNPDFIALYRYADPDALLELFGHLRAANPASPIWYKSADQLVADDYSGHLIALGGVDWNDATKAVLDRLDLPVRQVSEWDKEGGVYFEVTEEGDRKVPHRPLLDKFGGQTILREDVALFARAVSPFNRKRIVTICNGMYGRGTYGTVRALTDERFRDRNMEYIQARFPDSESFCILTRVTVENGVTLTPDWTLPETRLFEWPSPR